MSAVPKDKAYRNRKLLDLAHDFQVCQIRIPGVCENYSIDGCEPAHANRQFLGKGFSRKADDYAFAASCHSCHAMIDQGPLDAESKWDYWLKGYFRTVKILWEKGRIKVAVKPPGGW